MDKITVYVPKKSMKEYSIWDEVLNGRMGGLEKKEAQYVFSEEELKEVLRDFHDKIYQSAFAGYDLYSSHYKTRKEAAILSHL